jgi:raffinose/stachyose/melibiose transport system permease protein
MNQKSFKRKRYYASLTNYSILILLGLFAILPILMPVINSLRTNYEISLNPFQFPTEFHWENYVNAWIQGNFSTTMRNSLILVLGTVAGVLIFGGAAAYSLARLDPVGGNFFMIYVLGLSTLPIWVYVIPLFILWRDLGILSTLHGLIIIYIAVNSPFSIFLLRSYLIQIPRDLDDAARVDGANELQVLTLLVLPVMWPGFLTIALLVGLGTWSEFQLAYIFMLNDKLLPVATSFFRFRLQFGNDWALVNAASVIMALPVILFFLFLQRRFIEGLTLGSVK